MPIHGWRKEVESGVCTVLLEVEGSPVISLANYAVLLTGPPGKFFFGMDIREIEALETVTATRGQTAMVQDMLNELEATRSPIICAVDGECFGGGLELVMAGHVVFATPESAFGLPEINLGTIPSFGGTQRLARIIGRNRALHVSLTGRRFSARQAFDWGLVAELFPAEEPVSGAKSYARRVAALSRHAVGALLTSTINGLDGPLSRGLSLESAESSRLAGRQDLREGIRAFFEKRRPRFSPTTHE
ncbi:MAG: enoyl-CoA hydratase-related protein [Deltaproteobacteria bacterium]